MKTCHVTVVAAASLLLWVPIMASAQQVPRFDVEAHCEELAGFGGEYSNTMYNTCIDVEQSAYDGLKGQWASLPASIRNHCEELARFGGPGSYSMLETCVDMEVSAGNNRSQFSFD